MVEESQIKMLVIVISTISLLLQIIGCVTPGWLNIAVEYISIQSGLWYAVTCVHSKCVTAVGISGIPGANIGSGIYLTSMKLYQGLTVTGIILCVVAVILLCRSRCSSMSTDGPIKIAMINLLLSGILAVAAAGKFGSGLLTAINTYSIYNQEHPYKFSYSLLITGTGGLLAFVVFLYLACTLCRKRDNESTSGPQRGIVLSTVPHGKV
ncbi:hypothetical protein ACF0H5_011444 [Mactra antiquata]